MLIFYVPNHGIISYWGKVEKFEGHCYELPVMSI